MFSDGLIPLRQLKPTAVDCYTHGITERKTELQMGLWTEILADTDMLLSAKHRPKYFSQNLNSLVSSILTLALKFLIVHINMYVC